MPPRPQLKSNPGFVANEQWGKYNRGRSARPLRTLAGSGSMQKPHGQDKNESFSLQLKPYPSTGPSVHPSVLSPFSLLHPLSRLSLLSDRQSYPPGRFLFAGLPQQSPEASGPQRQNTHFVFCTCLGTAPLFPPCEREPQIYVYGSPDEAPSSLQRGTAAVCLFIAALQSSPTHLPGGECLEFLPQVEEFKCLRILFTNEGRREREIDRRIGEASAVKRALYRSVVVKRELSQKAKLSIYWSLYVPTLIYGHELGMVNEIADWIMTEKTRSQIQLAKMGFLCRVSGLSLRDRVRSLVIREGLRVEPLLLHVKRSQLRWLGCLLRLPFGRLPGEVFQACPTGRRPKGRPRTRWRDYVSWLAWERLGIPPEELEQVAGEREVCASLLKLLPPQPDLKWKKMDGWSTTVIKKRNSVTAAAKGPKATTLSAERNKQTKPWHSYAQQAAVLGAEGNSSQVAVNRQRLYLFNTGPNIYKRAHRHTAFTVNPLTSRDNREKGSEEGRMGVTNVTTSGVNYGGACIMLRDCFSSDRRKVHLQTLSGALLKRDDGLHCVTSRFTVGGWCDHQPLLPSSLLAWGRVCVLLLCSSTL
ncbi:hypothetical protein CCH79_00012754 [Gambusia affinis]|uniref:Uncharacterized protein n=1 Tax=Gambusia affinis TaxID=33528 RepID=A0A315V0M5_GAMAF|nr:hypothetical protein CCH79_00012754 [Gambusia affinis]